MVDPFVFDSPVRTARLVLRPIVAADFDDVHAYMSRDDVATWLLEDAYTLERSREQHPNYTRRTRLDPVDSLLLVAIEHEGRVVAIANLRVGNGASARLCERLGMRREAHHVQDICFKGVWSDTYQYAILASEWRAR